MRKLALRVGRKSLLSAMVALLLCLSAMLGLLAASSSDRVDAAARESPNGDYTIPVRTLALTGHAPIYIDGNSGFTNASGVTWGSGTESDPYIIADWNISAWAANGIWIQNTDAHFIVRNCYVHDGWMYYYGIYLSNSTNGSLEDNICSGDLEGIFLYLSDNNTLRNNSCNSNEGSGMWLWDSSNNTLLYNTCSNNFGMFEGYGIIIVESSGNTLYNNNCSDNTAAGIVLGSSSFNIIINNNCCSNYQIGIYLSSSNDNTVSNNTCSDNSWGICLESSSNNWLTNNTCNWNWSHPPYYESRNKDSPSYETPLFRSGGIYLADYANHNNLYYNNCRGNHGDGISLTRASSNTLSNNNCSSNNRWGIEIGGSSENIVLRNQLCDNLQHGVNIGEFLGTNSSSNIVFNNTFIGNNGAGSAYDPSHVQAYDDGTSDWWNGSDGHGNYWGDWTTPDVNPPFGIVDLPYNISGSAGAKDYYPLTTTPTEPIPEFAMMPLVVMVLLVATILTGRARRGKAQ